jgi:hypothetical protein
VLQNAVKLQKKRGDNYLSVDTLLLAVLDNKDVAEALNESGMPLMPSDLVHRHERSHTCNRAKHT